MVVADMALVMTVAGVATAVASAVAVVATAADVLRRGLSSVALPGVLLDSSPLSTDIFRG